VAEDLRRDVHGQAGGHCLGREDIGEEPPVVHEHARQLGECTPAVQEGQGTVRVAPGCQGGEAGRVAQLLDLWWRAFDGAEYSQT
jgi:hypothetical protein